MKYPENCDPRAHKFFHTVVVGQNFGEDGTAYKTTWDNDHAEARPTPVFVIDHYRYCQFCNEQALPLQPNIRHDDYGITGYACVCKDAMDWVDVEKALEDLADRYEKERLVIEAKRPRATEEAKLNAAIRHLKSTSGLSLEKLVREIGVMVDKGGEQG